MRGIAKSSCGQRGEDGVFRQMARLAHQEMTPSKELRTCRWKQPLYNPEYHRGVLGGENIPRPDKNQDCPDNYRSVANESPKSSSLVRSNRAPIQSFLFNHA